MNGGREERDEGMSFKFPNKVIESKSIHWAFATQFWNLELLGIGSIQGVSDAEARRS